MGWEVALGTVGRVVATQVVRTWLAHRMGAGAQRKNLTELVQMSFRDRIVQRRVERQVEEIADRVEQRLTQLCSAEFRGLADNERRAALDAVAESIAAADLSDVALFAADANSAKLLRELRRRVPDGAARSLLDEAGTNFYEMMVRECVEEYVRMVVHLDAFVPRASQEMLNRLSDIGGELGRVLDRLPARQLYAPSGTDFDEDFTREYLGVISETLDELELFGVDVHNYRPRTTLSVAYISLNATAENEGSGRLQKARSTDRSAIPFSKWRGSSDLDVSTGTRVEQALCDVDRVLVRGEAGSGKSTLLRWLAVTAARGEFSGALREWNGCVPFLIKLRSFAGRSLPRPEHFLDETADGIAGHMPEAWADRQLRTGRALVMVDGVDELTTAQRPKVREWLLRLIAAYPRIRVVVTSRPAAAAANWLLDEGFRPVLLDRMTAPDIRSFVANWHEAAKDAGSLPPHVTSLVEYQNALLGRLESSPHLRSLATSPLLCAMLCALNLDRRRQLPRNRMSLYQAAFALLLHRRDAERMIPSAQAVALEDADKLSLFSDIAWRLAVYNRSEAGRSDVISWVGKRLETMPGVDHAAADVFDHMLHRCGVIQEVVPGRIDFVHRTFQEYLAAYEVARHDHSTLLVDKAHLDLWRETVIMAAGHAIEPLLRKMIGGLLDRADAERRNRRRLRLLVVACIETMSSVPPDIWPGVEGCLDALVPPKGKSESGSLASAGEHVLHRLPDRLDHLTEASAAATVHTACKINGPEALDKLARYGTDPRPKVVTELVSAWEYFEPVTYASRVLADSPLLGGFLGIGEPALIAGIGSLRNLKRLSVSGEFVEFSLLGEHPRVESLEVSSIQADGMDFLSRLRGLVHLQIWIDGSFAPGIDFLASLRGLRTLDLEPLDAVHDFTPIACLRALEELRLLGCKELADLSELGHHPMVGELLLAGPSLTSGLSLFPECFSCPQESCGLGFSWCRGP